MKRKIFGILLGMLCGVCLLSCKKKPAETTRPTLYYTTSEKSVLQSSNSFGLDLFQYLASSVQEDSNVFISPLSVSLALTMAYNGAATQTATAMQTTLGYQNMTKTEINLACKSLVQTLLNCDPKVIMNIANSIWYQNGFTVRDSFLNLNQTYFNASVDSANFNNPQTVNLINNWVDQETRGTIPQIITTIPGDVVMYLLNAIYFKGTWQTAFDSTKTAPDNFYLADGSSYTTKFMVQRGSFHYYANNLFSSVALPYGNGNFSMVILLPNSGNTCTTILNNLNQGNWNAWNAGLQDTSDVQVLLPKFSINYYINLNNALSAQGMGIAFTDAADFSGIDGAHDLSISFVDHKTYLQINEQGTTASAVTVIGFIATAMPVNPTPMPIIFNVNKPFILAIKENTTNSILFIGLIQKPPVQ